MSSQKEVLVLILQPLKLQKPAFQGISRPWRNQGDKKRIYQNKNLLLTEMTIQQPPNHQRLRMV